MVPREIVADYFQGLDWQKGVRLKYEAWAGIAKSGAQHSCCCCSSSESCSLSDERQMGKAWQPKADFTLLEHFLLQKKDPIPLLQAALCFLASGRAGMCRKAGSFSWQKMNESLCAGVERIAAPFSHTYESYGDIQSPTETGDGVLQTNKSKAGISVIRSCLLLCPILSHVVEASALENWNNLFIALSPTDNCLWLTSSWKCFQLWPQKCKPKFPRDWKISSRPFLCETQIMSSFYELGQIVAAIQLHLDHSCVSWLGFSFVVAACITSSQEEW